MMNPIGYVPQENITLETIYTVEEVQKALDNLTPNEQNAVQSCLDKANESMKRAREYLREARRIAKVGT